MDEPRPAASVRAPWRRPFARELLIVLAFAVMTAAMTWPYVTRLRDAVADPGDPYLVAWILWWDYHQTFTDPFNLFHANVFYPYRYTLAFSEHNYGIALLFFPLFALGARPLTVHAVALFFGFALCGYGAFRLARTLTGSYGAAWVAGIIFAFVPYRFHLLSHLPYLFSCWIPLLFEALVLFARERSRRRAVWLGAAFFMTGLTTITWLTLSLVPFALAGLYFVARYRLARDRDFWLLGAAALGAAGLALLPFMLPYYIASKLYGFSRSIDEARANSAWPVHWLSVENRNKLWFRMGENIPDGFKFKLFPGLLPLLLPLASLLTVGRADDGRLDAAGRSDARKRKALVWLDALAVVALAAMILAAGFVGIQTWCNLYGLVTAERALVALAAILLVRLSIAYPRVLRRGGEGEENLIASLRSERRCDAFWLGSMLAVVGFCYSLGMNFFFYKILYHLIPMFKSMRVPTRGAMFCYLGLALLSGLGARRLAEAASRRHTGRAAAAVYAVLAVALLVELNGAPLKFMRGDVFPDAVTLRLKETPMRGGLVVLPTSADFNHRHMLRAADHARPLVVGTSGFNPPYADEIVLMTLTPPLRPALLDLLERIPTSYLVVQNELLPPERRPEYELFIARAVKSGRLRFIKRFDGRDDLYAVTKTEPEAEAEEPLPFETRDRYWDDLLREDPVNLLGEFREWGQSVHRLYRASYGRMPRYDEFMADVLKVADGALMGGEEGWPRLEKNFRALTVEWTERPAFRAAFADADDGEYVDALLRNAGLSPSAEERAALVEGLRTGAETRATILGKVADRPEFAAREHNRSLVLLHFFGYLRRGPGEPPDTDMRGFDYWLRGLDDGGDAARLTQAFKSSFEYEKLRRQEGRE